MAKFEGFAHLERETVRRRVPAFDWRRFATPSPRNRLSRPLSGARIGLVSTAGARLRNQPPFDIIADMGDPTYRAIPASTPLEDLRFNHAGYDVRNAYADPDCVFPMPLLRTYAGDGRIGSLSARAYSLMGYITQAEVILSKTGPAIAADFVADQVDLALLVPA